MEQLLVELGLATTAETKLHIQSAVEWLNRKTTIAVDLKGEIQPDVKLFMLKYSQLMTIHTGVASESISGMSQSFVTGQSLENKIFDLAVGLFGMDAMRSTVTVHSGEDGWNYGC